MYMMRLNTSTVVVIDPAVEDYLDLVKGISPDAEIVVLKPDQDGVNQITEILTNRNNIESLHILSHGRPGEIYLGSTQLSLSNFSHYNSQLQSWTKNLTKNAEILLYGCQVAADAIGKRFVQQLSQLTDRAIAASTHLTGHTKLGGNWHLDFNTRAIQSPPILQPETIATYPHVLAVLDWSVEDWTQTAGAFPRTQTFTIGTVNVTITVTADAGVAVATLDDDNFFAGGYDFASKPDALRMQINPTTPGTGVTATVTFTDSVSGSPIAVSNASFEMFDVDDATPTWNDQVVITGTNAITSSSVAPTFTPSGNPSYTISGNTLTGNAASPNGDVAGTVPNSGRGTARVTFSSNITGFTLVFRDGPSITADPGSHGVAFLSNITFNNISPTTSDATVNLTPGTTVTLPTLPTPNGLGGSDADGSVTFYKIISLPSAADGVLYLGSVAPGNEITAGQVISAANLSNLVFDATAGFDGGSFTYAAIDDENGIDPSPALVTLNSNTSTNTPPTTSNASVAIAPNTTTNLTVPAGTDTDGTVTGYRIETLPAGADGQLYLSNPASGGTLIVAGQIIPATQIGQLFFQSTPGFNGGSFTYAAIDNNGAIDSTPATFSLTSGSDTTAPVITVNFLTTSDRTPQLTGTVDDPTATIQVTVNGNTYTATNNGNGTWTLADNAITPGLAIATYNVTATATDGSGNAGTDGTTNELRITSSTTPDTTPPVITVNRLVTTDRTPELTGTVDDPTATVRITVNGQVYRATNNGDGTWTLPDNTITPGLPIDTYSVTGRAIDTAGNVGVDGTRNELVIRGITNPDDDDCNCSDEPRLVRSGNAGNNVLRGAGGADRLAGRQGNDVLRGLGCEDSLSGGRGNDRLFGNGCNDLLRGNEGDDELKGGKGRDRLSGGLGRDQLLGGRGNDVLAGRQDDDRMFGERGNDILKGGRGNDTMGGGFGNDSLIGNSGNDLMRGYRGNDVLKGGRGNDTIGGGAGRDRLSGNTGKDLLRGNRGDDRLFGRQGDDRLGGGRNDDLLVGGRGEDLLIGATGIDVLRGQEGRDALFGGEGNDRLIGDLDNDVLVGGLGADVLRGGAGQDRLVYQNVDERGDRIIGFNARQDVIDLRQIFAKPGYTNTQRFQRYIRLAQVGANTVVRIDSNGDATGGFIALATIENATASALSANNFLVR
jgi:hypothetical protein